MVLQRLPQLPRLLLAWVLVMGVVAPSLWSAETVCPGVWKLRALSGPPARNIHAMAYDSVRRQVVLFGGRGTRGDPTSNRLGDTWEWDGTVWMHTANTGPSPRAYMAMDYDPTRQRVVVFGGAGSRMNPFQDTHDTWEWDGTVWTKVATSGPTARNAHGVAYDSARQRLVLFGGGVTFGGLFDDTWEWDGTAWTQRAPTVMPSLREAFGMAYDRVRGRVVLFGGIDLTGTVFGDTWAWD